MELCRPDSSRQRVFTFTGTISSYSSSGSDKQRKPLGTVGNLLESEEKKQQIKATVSAQMSRSAIAQNLTHEQLSRWNKVIRLLGQDRFLHYFSALASIRTPPQFVVLETHDADTVGYQEVQLNEWEQRRDARHGPLLEALSGKEADEAKTLLQNLRPQSAEAQFNPMLDPEIQTIAAERKALGEEIDVLLREMLAQVPRSSSSLYHPVALQMVWICSVVFTLAVLQALLVTFWTQVYQA
jgi:hypothetical protein